jgi:hypothetical protein
VGPRLGDQARTAASAQARTVASVCRPYVGEHGRSSFSQHSSLHTREVERDTERMRIGVRFGRWLERPTDPTLYS